MAMIKCGECGADVSDKAASCPHCGAPIASDTESKGSGVKKLTTTQGTSKSIKLQSALATLLVIIGGSWLVVVAGDEAMTWEQMQTPMWILIIGFILMVYSRIRKWWHHD